MRVFIGFDPRPAEVQCYAVARSSIRRRSSTPVWTTGLVLSDLRQRGLYTRPTEVRDGRLFDVISNKPMSTEFAISRFLVPELCEHGWALFVDADVMARADLYELYREADPSKAVMVVKHDYTPSGTMKMDGQVQLPYERKNWSSVMLFNCDHPANRMLKAKYVNEMPGLWLHQFKWLLNDEIGALDPKWNHLVGEKEANPNAAIVHFTLGSPSLPGYEDCEFAQEWRHELDVWAA